MLLLVATLVIGSVGGQASKSGALGGGRDMGGLTSILQGLAAGGGGASSAAGGLCGLLGKFLGKR